MIKLFLGELIGTFIFLSVIIYCVSLTPNDNLNLIKIGIGLITAIAIFGSITGGHFNPAVSVMFYLNNSLTTQNLGVYILAQVLGGVLALAIFKYFKQ